MILSSSKKMMVGLVLLSASIIPRCVRTEEHKDKNGDRNQSKSLPIVENDRGGWLRLRFGIGNYHMVPCYHDKHLSFDDNQH